MRCIGGSLERDGDLLEVDRELLSQGREQVGGDQVFLRRVASYRIVVEQTYFSRRWLGIDVPFDEGERIVDLGVEVADQRRGCDAAERGALDDWHVADGRHQCG